MGVKMLNRFLRDKTQDCLNLKPLSAYKNMRIVVDASIYMYRYIGDNALIENYYLLCSLFRHNNISALFVFDGVPPEEKHKEIKDRADTKKKAKAEIKMINEQLKDATPDVKKELETTKQTLQKQCIHIKQWHMVDVKQIIEATGHQYIEAPNESDHLCAKLVRDGLADACLSEDMDMFVHGCPKVLRYMSLTKESVVEYDLYGILETLGLSFVDFQELCILAGTDYSKWLNDKNDTTENKLVSKNIFEHYQDMIKYKYREFSKEDDDDDDSPKKYLNFTDVKNMTKNDCSYLTWCLDQNMITTEQYTKLQHILAFFEGENYPELNQEMYRPVIQSRPMNQPLVRKVLGYHNFY